MKCEFINYIISLKDPIDLIDKCEKNKINPILFKGIDGKVCKDDLIKRYFTPFYRYFGPKSSIGCALSHMFVWKSFLKTDSDYAIIFEDDIILDDKDDDLFEKIKFYVKETPSNFDILYLGALGSDDSTSFFTIMMSLLNMSSKSEHINDYIKKPRVALATHAYVISRQGAKKLINNLSGNIHNHIDYCIQNLYSKGILNNYITKPRLIYQSSTNSGISANVSNTYPIIINKMLSDLYLDKYVKASYITTLSIFRIGNINFNISTLIIIIILIFGYKNIYAFLFILLLSLSDILVFNK